MGTRGGEGVGMGMGTGGDEMGVGSGGGGMRVGTGGGGEMGVGSVGGGGIGVEVGSGGGGEMGVGSGGGGGMGEGSGVGRSAHTRVVDSDASQRGPDLPSLSQAQDPLSAQTLCSTPSVAAVGAGGQRLASKAFNSCASSTATGRGTAHTGSGLPVSHTPLGGERGRGGEGEEEVKSVGEFHSEDKENSATRCLVERQEKQLQALQEKVRGCRWERALA